MKIKAKVLTNICHGGEGKEFILSPGDVFEFPPECVPQLLQSGAIELIEETKPAKKAKPEEAT